MSLPQTHTYSRQNWAFSEQRALFHFEMQRNGSNAEAEPICGDDDLQIGVNDFDVNEDSESKSLENDTLQPDECEEIAKL